MGFGISGLTRLGYIRCIGYIGYIVFGMWLLCFIAIANHGLRFNFGELLFLIWLSEHDQNTVGLGVVGIDFEDIRWNKTEFEDHREFIMFT